MMLVLSGILVVPFLVSSTICPGADIIDMRVKLIAGTFVSSGIATIVQTTFGLRLPVLHGPSFAFIPTLIAFANLPENKCNADVNTVVPEEEYIDKLLTIQGSLFVAVLVMPLIACTGLVGVFSKFVGPVTTCPLMIMLCMGSVPTAAEKMSLHWISIVQFCILASFAIFLENVLVPIPYFSIARRKFKFARVRVFGSFPYLIGVGCAWLICGILTWTNLEPERGEARVDKNETLTVLAHSPWFQVPIPLRFGFPRFSIGLFFGFVASTFACIVESVGDYGILAKVAMQRHPPQSSVNRAMMAEGFGSLLSAVMGVGTAVTTYAEAIALVPVTKVACRATMQLAGTLLIILGLFTKVAALLASIPDAVVGGVLAMGMAMIAGVALSNLQNVDLRLSRNLTIMGTAILVGSVVPKHFQDNPIDSGNATVDSIFNMLFGIQMLIGGLVAFILDNTVPGATKEQRGIKTGDSMAADDFSIDDDGYSFPSPVNKFILRFPSLCKLPFIPPKRKIESVEDLRNGSFSSKESGSSINKPFSISAPSLINTISAKL
ncbi:hypothetical protein WR25_01899 [Diploscapter pachys]|uniref:SLC26A/SulP transporter domain-containing protein n=1 Tax=Diploscapter pachys TaxID=2018661 RepID=A0A2A2KY35_9BILA|nr:hypothetical protein WR25_01899 [Diploscapter pachys]